MDVSHFELIFKPQAPPDQTAPAPPADVLQGYFLKITNREDREYRFALDFVTVEPDPFVPGRSLSGTTVVIIDRPSSNNTFGTLVGGNGLYNPSNGLIPIAPNETALIVVLPAVFGPTPPVASADYEVRGYVRLRLPPTLQTRTIRIFGREFTFTFFGPQARSPVSVMVTAQNRASYIEADSTISDQTQSSLPLCGGGSCMEIPPRRFRPFPFGLSADDLRQRSALEGLVSSEETRSLAPDLLQILDLIDPTAEELKTFNAALEAAEIPFQLERRKPSKQTKRKAASSPPD